MPSIADLITERPTRRYEIDWSSDSVSTKTTRGVYSSSSDWGFSDVDEPPVDVVILNSKGEIVVQAWAEDWDQAIIFEIPKLIKRVLDEDPIAVFYCENELWDQAAEEASLLKR